MRRSALAWAGMLAFAAAGCSRGDEDPAPAEAAPGRTTEVESGPADPARDATGSVTAGAAGMGVGDPWFLEEAASRGLDFRHHSGQAGAYLIPEIMSGGAAAIDADGDGWLDLYCVQSGTLATAAGPDDEASDSAALPRPTNRLYRNLGEARFVDVTDGSGADDSGYGIGCTSADVDGDGRADLYVTNVGPNVLLRNVSTQGAIRFADHSAQAGVDHAGFGAGAAFFDGDADGHLDLFVVNYLIWSPATERVCHDDAGKRDYCSPAAYNAPAPDVLYRNRGDGTFEDVSDAAGIAMIAGTGLGIVCVDFTGDGLPDVFIANDGMPDRLWVNLGGMRFRDEAMQRGCAVDDSGAAKAGMGVAVADLHGQDRFDLIVCNLVRETDSLFRNDGAWFTDITARSGVAGVSRHFTRFGVGFVDFDHDGEQDLFIACGRVARAEPLYTADPYAEPDLLLRGLGGGRFAEQMPRGGSLPARYGAGRAAVFGDFDNDGAVDIVVVQRDAPLAYLRNVASGDRAWLIVRAIDGRGRDAIGSIITVHAGARSWRRPVLTGSGYLSGQDPRVHLGLGNHRTVDAIEIRWPDGITERLDRPAGIPVDRVLTARRGSPETWDAPDAARAAGVSGR